MHADLLTIADLDGPRGLPGLGNLLGFARGGTPHRALYRWHERYGPTYRMRLPGTEIVVTSAPAIIETVLRDRPGAFRRGQFVSDLIDELGGYGLFSAEGEDWRRLRRVATRGLSTRYLRQSFGTILRSAGRLTDRWGAARPQRWLAANPTSEANGQPYVPFGSGPRFCPGRRLGLLEATLIVAMTCHAYTIEPDSSAGPVGERETFALLPTNLGVRLRSASREPA